MLAKSSSLPSSLSVVTFQLITSSLYQENLDTMLSYLASYQETDIIIFPEVYLTGFAYDDMRKAALFSQQALDILQQKINTQMVIFSLILEENNSFINQSVVIHQNKLVYKQNKAKLFKLGKEDKYFHKGDTRDILVFHVSGIRYAILLCFELRFKHLWQQIEGADIVFIPAQWGKVRKVHLEVLSRALAIINQCYVIVSNGGDNAMGGGSSICSPFGNVEKSINSVLDVAIEGTVQIKEIQKMRRYIVLEE